MRANLIEHLTGLIGGSDAWTARRPDELRRLACLLQAGLGGFGVLNRLGRGGVGFAPLRFGAARRRLLGGTGPGRSGGDLLSGFSGDRVGV